MIENRCDCEPQNVELVNKARKKMPEYGEISDLSDFFKVMGDSTRLQLLMALQLDEFCVSDLSYLLNMTRSAISHQLKNLRTSNLVKTEKIGKNVYYSISDEHIKIILKYGLEHISEVM